MKITAQTWKQIAKKYWRRDYYDINRVEARELDEIACRNFEYATRLAKLVMRFHKEKMLDDLREMKIVAKEILEIEKNPMKQLNIFDIKRNFSDEK